MCAAAVPGHEARTSTGGGLGAYLGHEPSDNSGHERTTAESQTSWAHLHIQRGAGVLDQPVLISHGRGHRFEHPSEVILGDKLDITSGNPKLLCLLHFRAADPISELAEVPVANHQEVRVLCHRGGAVAPQLTVNDLAENRRHGFGIYGQGYVDAIREAAARRNVPTQ
jgi:hypothetical protein